MGSSYSRATGPSVHDVIVGHCQAAGFTPRISQQGADVQTIVSLVAAGPGVSLLIAPTPPSTRRPSSTASCPTTCRRGGSRWPGRRPTDRRYYGSSCNWSADQPKVSGSPPVR
ncbi:hypothetical protein [Kribbella sp. DT2]|uniref:hypothetical protein n=1 Tax=Kribbella sp. DT2 TaxID=3393427 RepID=UPI003CE7AE58